MLGHVHLVFQRHIFWNDVGIRREKPNIEYFIKNAVGPFYQYETFLLTLYLFLKSLPRPKAAKTRAGGSYNEVFKA